MLIQSCKWPLVLAIGFLILGHQSEEQKNDPSIDVVSPTQAQLRAWAKTEHLTESAAEAIFETTGSSLSQGYQIDNLDAHTLRPQNRILLSTWEPGTGHCLAVHLIDHKDSKLHEFWSVEQTDQEENFCTESRLGAAHAYLTPQQVIVQIPSRLSHKAGRAPRLQVKCLAFAPTAEGYRFVATKTVFVDASKYRIAGRYCTNH